MSSKRRLGKAGIGEFCLELPFRFQASPKRVGSIEERLKFNRLRRRLHLAVPCMKIGLRLPGTLMPCTLFKRAVGRRLT